MCSLNKGSLDLVMQIVSQIVDAVGPENLSSLHLGQDEIFNYATCRECKLFVSQTGRSALFTRWIKKVVSKVK